MNIVSKIDNEEKRKRVSEVLYKYTSLKETKFSTDTIKFDFSFSSGSTNILSVESVSKDPEPGNIWYCFDESIFSFPDEVIDVLISESKQKSINPFIYCIGALENTGGFNWGNTKEGFSYWNDIIMNKKFELLSNSKKETVIIEITEIDSQEKKEAISELMDSYTSINPGSIGNTIGFELEVKKDGGKIQDIRLIHVIMDPSTIEEKIVRTFHHSAFNLRCIDLLLSRSRIKNNLLIYLYHPAPLEKEGGFSWGKSPEGFDYWNGLIKDKRFKNLNNEMEKDLEIVKVLNLDTKEKVERLKYVFSKYLHFPISGFKLDAEHGISIGIKTNRCAGRKLNSASVTQVTLINETSDKFSRTDFDNSVFCLPDNILERLIELSSIKSLVPYILNLYANSEVGGFNWGDTEERYAYWNNILELKKFEHTYKSLSTMCKINYKTKKLISKEANEEKKVDFYVRETQLNVENELLNREKERAGVEEELNDLKSSYPLNLTAILKHQERLEELDAEIKVIKSLKKELGFEKDDKTKEGK